MFSRAFIQLKSHVFNEGRIALRRRSVGKLGYGNQDPVLMRYFMDLVRALGGDVRGEPRFAHYILVIEANPVLARALDTSGLPFGRKTRTDPPLDPLLKTNRELFRYHIRVTLTEEGWCSLTITRGRRVNFILAWGRSVDITEKFTSEQIENLRQISKTIGKRKIPIKGITIPELQTIIRANPPRSLDMEVDFLNLSHRALMNDIHPTKVNLSKDGRVTAFWEIHFSKPEKVDLINKEYGMLPGTWKERRFENLYDTFVRYRGRRLTNEEIQEVRKVKEENPPKVTAEWISEKMRELFPNVEWGADIEWIRKKLGRKKKQVKSLVEEAFKYYGKDVLFEKQFIKYYRDRGMSKDEVDRLWVKAHSMKILRIGAKPMFREKPYKILGNIMVFRLLGKEDI